uniref:Uncharacterized protein n=1 Tax=Candidatus Kentrum sp. LPFa TaxID=2126335 RepID=A0A450W850_9GAMM|nr:MAG: hypothetical protein BECKLPF1236B_GA0070989_10251 [Candidatus Kentron sp. LPFa]VFK12550.1 MAG: hypothetical protein BECKLPF1236B_GA0070989_103721 [Candidatus Kentron sp. LPFa]VFK13215.1 MAG: hypothetical protein BECKLPF1236B_GA0070989_104424 [Candidatus Kentron sp. LPFa]VFK16579.1 MAG: hypothetical protein BECKLPF1236B_GA0070989_109722 [Candidatus Kentron sp. LPFa]VFK16710.1 MAG: hypothetical protein BECKLPF1236B_GA0070989_110013 [Candidatus Kentron sp. LPFa]
MRLQCFGQPRNVAYAEAETRHLPNSHLPGPSVAVGRPSTLATYPTFRRVRASGSVQVRTRTGRIRPIFHSLWLIDRTVYD